LKTIVALARRRRFFVTVLRAERDSLRVRVLDFPLGAGG